MAEETTIASKPCSCCKVVKPLDEYSRNAKTKDKLFHQCKVCWQINLKAFRKKSLTRRTTGRMHIFQEPDEIQKIASCFIENPYAKSGEVADKLNMPLAKVNYFMSRNEYLKAMRMLATKKMSSMVPMALKGMKESLLSKTPEIKYKSSVEVLKNENILGPAKVDISINNMSDLTINQLQEIVERAKVEPIKQTIIEAEVVQ